MSSATSSSQTLSRPYQAPRRNWLARINWRIAVFGAVVLMLVGVPFYIWADEVITGGIHNHGSYKEVDLKAMSSFDMDQINGTMQDIPQKFRALEGQKVLMIGEMWAPQEAGEGKLSYFVLVYSKTKCCFNGPPLAQHFVDGNVAPGAEVYYYETPVNVWGTVHIYVRKDAEGVIKSIYHVDVEKVEPIEN
ncbi:MAG: hypothetical protein ABSF29_09580 [Tepidisphaeraceae bacterium]|jgi:hypothetical protein